MGHGQESSLRGGGGEKIGMSAEYDPKKSEDEVGQLYPILLAKDGKVIDGIHRLRKDGAWRTEILDYIDSEEKFLLARCVANWHRRAVPRSEKEEWINELARVYREQGLKIRGERTFLDGASTTNEIIVKLAETTGLGRQTVLKYLSNEYKQTEHARVKRKPRIPASQRIEKRLGQEVVERHREEVREELLEEVKEESKAEAKKELRQDADFLIEAAQTVEQVLPTLKPKVISREGYHIPTITAEQRAQIKAAQKRTAEQLKERRKDPWIQQRAKWWKAMEAMMVIVTNIDDVFCPICGKPASTHLRFLCHPDLDMKTVQRMIDEKLDGELIDEKVWKEKHGFTEASQ